MSDIEDFFGIERSSNSFRLIRQYTVIGLFRTPRKGGESQRYWSIYFAESAIEAEEQVKIDQPDVEVAAILDDFGRIIR